MYIDLWGLNFFRGCLKGGGGPHVREVSREGSPHLSCKRDQIKTKDYMDKRVTSPTRGPPLPRKQVFTEKSTE